MLLTLLEILVFMILAALVGVALGWILRGSMSNEQAELVELRTKLRECKKAQRDASSNIESDGDTAGSEPTKRASTASKVATAGTATASTASGSTDEDADKAATQAAARAEVAKLVARVSSDGTVDDLKQIYGIGPKFEGMLNDMGITSYKQIAQFSKDDVNTVADAIGAFKDRVVRDDWVSGAKAAYKEAYGKSV